MKQNIAPRPESKTAILSPNQRRAWRHYQSDPDSPSMNRPLAIMLSGEIREELITRTVELMIQRHEILRTSFRPSGDTAELKVREHIFVEVQSTDDLRDVPEEELQEELNWLLLEACEQPFEVEHELLIRFSVFQVSATEVIVLLVFHQLILDRSAEAIVIEEFGNLYSALVEQGAFDPASPNIQYSDYAYGLQQRIQTGGFDREFQYWKSKWSSNNVWTRLPTDHPALEFPSFQGAKQHVTLPQDLVDSLCRVAAEKSVDLADLVLSAFSLLLHIHSGSRDLIIGTDIDQYREHPCPSLIGLFDNPIGVRCQFSADTLDRLVYHTSLELKDAYAHQELPHDAVRELLELGDMDHQFMAVFSFRRNLPVPGDVTPSFKRHVFDNCTADYDWELNVQLIQAGLHIELSYNTDLFEPATIARALAQYENILGTLSHGLDVTLAQCMASSQSGAVADARGVSGHRPRPGNTFTEFTRADINQPIADRFRQQVALFPDNIAVQLMEEMCTYRQLDQRSNQIANSLLHRCGREQQRIAVLFGQGSP